MASGIPGSTSKGKFKILISSSSTKGISYSKGGGGGDKVPPRGGGGDGVPPGGGDVGGRPRHMVDNFRRVRVAAKEKRKNYLSQLISSLFHLRSSKTVWTICFGGSI
ncbi:hypothetical protein C1H46_040840 [Malus baccata]|uniref:Uncharacterized protein n=1 Tax=Malus baccata TaxID=106549 RepID=A0A540KHD0_MALBA|nr:hypothetical protein C1H46_040840 [Malus baccata]